MGLTDEILEEHRKRQEKKKRGQKKDKEESTELYQDTLTMREFKLTPAQWKQISRIDRKILYYSRLMESIYMDMDQETNTKINDAEAKRQAFLNSLPMTVTMGKR